jgi:hypothetical protein
MSTCLHLDPVVRACRTDAPIVASRARRTSACFDRQPAIALVSGKMRGLERTHAAARAAPDQQSADGFFGRT